MDSKRLNGLDSLRAFAIILVLMTHYRLFSHEYTFGFLTAVGWTGVDLFFVLSGYLIGNQIFTSLAQHRDIAFKNFYSRRLLRTLPNYYLVLALYYVFPLTLSGDVRAPIGEFLTFTQNNGLRPEHTFTHSWSLCIEEQFYLFFPALAYLIFKSRYALTYMWIALAGLFLSAMMYRSFNWLEHGQAAITGADYWQYIYYSSFTRFDELLPGIAIALIKNFYPSFWSHCLKKGNFFLATGLVASGFMFYVALHYRYIDNYGFSALFATFGFSGVSLSFALLVMAGLSPHTLLNRFKIPGSASLALWSYAIYLIHKPLWALAIAPLQKVNIDVRSWTAVTLMMGAALLAGWLMHRLVELPFLKLRDRYFSPPKTAPSNAGLLPDAV
jgi:peptidoglycan/LPS O-acetylase OafA/YrhL